MAPPGARPTNTGGERMNYCIECREDIPATEENEGVYLCATCAREHDTPSDGAPSPDNERSCSQTDRYVAMQGHHGWYIAWVASDGTIERLPLGGGQTYDRAMAQA